MISFSWLVDCGVERLLGRPVQLGVTRVGWTFGKLHSRIFTGRVAESDCLTSSFIGVLKVNGSVMCRGRGVWRADGGINCVCCIF